MVHLKRKKRLDGTRCRSHARLAHLNEVFAQIYVTSKKT